MSLPTPHTPGDAARVSRRTLLRRGVVAGSTLAVGARLAAPAAAAPAPAGLTGMADAAQPLRLARVWAGEQGIPAGLDATHKTFAAGRPRRRQGGGTRRRSHRAAAPAPATDPRALPLPARGVRRP